MRIFLPRFVFPMTAFGLLLSSVLTAQGADITGIIQRQQIEQTQDWRAEALEGKADREASFPRYDWWRGFQDEPLNIAVHKALEQNPSLKAAQIQIAAAESSAKIAKAPMFPTLSFNPQYTWERFGQNQFVFPLQKRTFQVFQVPLNASYELDLFGKNLANYRAVKQNIPIARAQYEAARIQLSGMVATAYFNVAKWRYLEQLSQIELASSQRLLGHSQRLLDLGQATVFDIQNAQQRLDQAQVNVSQYALNRQVAENQLMALMGEAPTSHQAPPVSDLTALAAPPRLETGLPSRLLIHRPDVTVAEHQLAAARFDIQAARRAMMPSLMLNGNTGFNAVGVKNLFRGTSWSSLATGALNQPIFVGGRLRGELGLRKAHYEQLLQNYESTLINAFTDTENSLATLRADQVIYQDVLRQTENARDKAARQQAQYQAGLTGEPLWLAEDVQRLAYEKQLAQQKAQLLVDVVSVSKALGGGY